MMPPISLLTAVGCDGGLVLLFAFLFNVPLPLLANLS